MHADLCKTCLDANSLSNFKKEKCLKDSIKDPLQSYLHLTIDQQNGKNYQSIYKEKVGKIIQSLMYADETAAIVKCSECVVKVNDIFAVLEDDFRTKSSQLPKHLSKNMRFSTDANLRVMLAEFVPMCVFYTQNVCKLFSATYDAN